MALTIQEFENGVAYWKDQTTWPDDFHNRFYARLAAESPNGQFTAAWWMPFLKHLTAWRANRPVSGATLTANALPALPALTAAWEQCCAPYLDLDIADVTWAQVSGFPAAVGPIKPGGSPVFTSKFCHFLAPQIFPVIDNEAMGIPFRTYEAYFEAVRAEWAATTVTVQRDLQGALTSLISPPLAPNYGLTNKLVELSLIGRRHGQTGE